MGGPDVWEVIRAVKFARSAEPDLPEAELLSLVADNSGLSVRCVRTAVAYWATYPGEVDALLEYAARAEQATALSQDRTNALLAR